MTRQWLVWTLVAILGMAGTGQAQMGSETSALRQQIQALQEKLAAAEKSSMERRRITQLGTSPVRQKETEPALVVRVYDLSDLFSLAPPYPATRAGDLTLGGAGREFFPGPVDQPRPAAVSGAMGMGGMGGMGGGMFSVKSGVEKSKPAHAEPASPAELQPGGLISARTSIDDLIDTITSTIAPTEWDQVGGAGSIAPLGNLLVVSTTDQNHEQIGTLLDTLRERWKTLRTISVEAHWLWLTEVQLASLLGAEAKSAAKPGQSRAYGLVDDKAWSQLSDELHRNGNDRPAGYHAVVTCYNGQTVHGVSGGQSLIVVGMIPVVGGGAGADAAGVGYQPQVSTIHQGAVLQITPITSTSGQFVTLDLHSRVTRAETPTMTAKTPPPGMPFPEGPLAVTSAIDRPLLHCHQLETTLRIPVERRMLVGGMTFDIEPSPGEPNLYLFVRAVVQELRDEQLPAKMDGRPAAGRRTMPGAMPGMMMPGATFVAPVPPAPGTPGGLMPRSAPAAPGPMLPGMMPRGPQAATGVMSKPTSSQPSAPGPAFQPGTMPAVPAAPATR